jgi:hypothetical protein
VETRNSEQPLISAWALRLMAFGALAVLVGAATPPGATMAGAVQRFLALYAGVIALVAMSIAVVSGLVATERLILRIQHRVLAQGVHRAMALISVTFLVAHFLVKALEQHVTPVQIVVPGAGPVGLGALAFDLMLIVLITGALRAKFAARAHPWVWRMFHAIAYLCWPIAISHGLTAGRAPAEWVKFGYGACLVAVGLGVVVRMMVTVRPRSAPRQVPDAAPAPAPEYTQGQAQEQRQDVPAARQELFR